LTHIKDPGAGLPREQAREARKAAWKRPQKAADRQRLRAERILAVTGGEEDGNSSLPEHQPR
jgi:hypothetical protein